MRTIVSLVAIMGLSACMGGGGGSSTNTTASVEPDIDVTNDISNLLDGARSNSLMPLEYSPVVGQVVQDHAQDMVDRGYLSIFDQGSTGCAGANGVCDMGDDLNDRNRRWDEIVQMVADGDKTVAMVFSEFQVRDAGNNVGEGDIGDKLDLALTVEDNFEFFALGKAGTGADTKWAFVVVDPVESWSNR